MREEKSRAARRYIPKANNPSRLVRLTYNGDGVVEVARGSKAETVLRRAGWREA